MLSQGTGFYFGEKSVDVIDYILASDVTYEKSEANLAFFTCR